jgi:hypothetical protein
VLLKDIIDTWDIYFSGVNKAASFINQGIIIKRIAVLCNLMGSCHLLSLMLLGKIFYFVKMHPALSFSIRKLLQAISEPVSSLAS